jgi:hypothetical protein
MLAFAFERPAHGGKGFGERKNFGGDQQIGVLCPDRMPIDPVRRDGDFRQQIRARQRNALRCGTAQGNSADHPIRLADLARVEEAAEILALIVARGRRRHSHAEAFGARAFDALQGACP